MGTIAEEVAQMEEDRDCLVGALSSLVALLQGEPHRPHDGSMECLRCRADRLAEEFAL